jgi:Sulfotransferase domain
MKGPDFILIGAMKCGTSTLASQLGAQPGLFMTTPKEPNYFSDDAVFARGPDWYGALFDGAGPGDLRGEASTHYTKRPDYPDTITRMKAAVPAPRLVYMIRDPMVRLVSHYLHALSENWTSESLGRALETVPQLVGYGCYGWQIAPFVEAFGRDAVLLTSLERQKADPDGELARIAAHLGHDGPVQWRADLGVQNMSAQRVRKLPLHGLLVDNPVATALRRALVPKALRTRIRDARRMTVRPSLPDAARPALAARFAEDRAALAAFFPGDPSLTLAYPFLDPVQA